MNQVLASIKDMVTPSFLLPRFDLSARDDEHEPGFFEPIMDDLDVVEIKGTGMQTQTVLSVDDLPPQGDADVIYKDQSSSDMYRWDGATYQPYNPYTDAKVEMNGSRRMLIDPTAAMPHGGDLRLGTVYNVWTLREDLRRCAELKIGLESLIPQHFRVRKEDQRSAKSAYTIAVENGFIGTEHQFLSNEAAKLVSASARDIMSLWLVTNHSALVQQLKRIMHGRNDYDRNAVEGLAAIGVDVWYDEAKQKVGFKDGAFVALV